MRLSMENGTELKDPSPAEIDQALRTLNRSEDNSFAILEQADLTYLQVAQEDDPDQDAPRLVLEYQDGSMDRHYQAVADSLSLMTVIEIFQAYAGGDEKWRSRVQWEPMQV